MVTIYALLDESQIRYIGKTKQTDLLEKYNQHIKEAQEQPEKYDWINNMLKQGQMPKIKSIFTFPEEESKQYEKKFLEDFRHLINTKPTFELV
jgi:hypothetical protein